MEDDYRQNEFLNASALSSIQEEFVRIKDIWDNQSTKTGDYTLFKNCHVRRIIGAPDLTIGFGELKKLLNCSSTGQVIINGETLINGFAIETGNTSYFGRLNIDTVTELCISQWNQNSRSEIVQINRAFNLLFVNWYHCDVIKND